MIRFVKSIAVIVLVTTHVSFLQAQPARVRRVEPFALEQVTITPGTRLYNMTMKNADYLLWINVDRLLYSYRQYAGLDTRGVKGYGGWESADGPIRGEFAGHYISACSKLYYQVKKTHPEKAAQLLEKVNGMVAGLAECQQAISNKKGADYPGHPGYLNAQNASQFDRLESLQAADVPYYIIHKILAGLLDAYRYTGNKRALQVAILQADYFSWRMGRLSQSTIEAMLNTRRYTGQYQGYFMEFGGMQDVLLKLYTITKKPAHLKLANTFSRPWFTEMLVGNEDELGRNAQHSNSEVPAVQGIAHTYELTGNKTYKTATLNFLTWMREGHEFSTGSISGKSAYPAPLDYGGELFHYPNNINYQVNSSPGHQGHASGETCCSHNLNKITQLAFCWTMDERWADAYERRYVNAVMAQQNPDDGMFIYNLNLRQGAVKEFGDAENAFWCCYGSGVEAYAGLSEGVYYTDRKNGLWINQLHQSSLNWKEKDLTLRQETSFPENGYSKITFTARQSTLLTLHIRIPAWAGNKASIKLNGRELDIAKKPGSFAVVQHAFTTGDVLEIDFPYTLSTAPMPDAPEYIAVNYGPHVLVNTGEKGAVFNGNAQQLTEGLQPGSKPCEFTATLNGKKAIFKPISSIVKEQYNGYTLVSAPQKLQLTDQLLIGDAASEKAHNLQAIQMNRGEFNGKQWIDVNNGWLSFNLKSSPAKNVHLKFRYWGSDSSDRQHVRLFDISVLDDTSGRYIPVTTQSLEKQAPGQWYDVLYPIPARLTSGRQQINVRIDAKGFYGKPGKVGGLFEVVEIGYLNE
ncbi:beta-L-arabinofuranosidase domain-containing protein [Foetidibacter luteolus]|uniref:beta-L-arabinofuranosidase domain-containing protein n=1 Tax=Foetidibacter luteolus TaxID=2608880 RepID=UPI00129A150A|nr:beta-L-arabinofuranosidase domain-containing protein [Foetidibacter luteolus]